MDARSHIKGGITIGIIAWIILALVLQGFLFTWIVAGIIYSRLLVRPGKDGWGRGPSMPDDPEYMQLYDQAEAWHEQWKDRIKEVDTISEGYHLYGELFDFGSDKTVIILSGRMESCHYGCHYAEPYRRAGWNVLTIDGRAHGLSDGKINSLGYREYRDVLAWAKLLHEQEKSRLVLFHGICIGSSTAVFAAVSPSCPDYVAGIVADGMYQRFMDSFRNHMAKDHRPQFPFLWETMVLIRLISGANVVTDGPYKRIRALTRPILFLHSREDPFSTPEKAQQLYDLCPSAKKKIVWFDHGGHSRLRITNPEAYDQAIVDYLTDLAL